MPGTIVSDTSCLILLNKLQKLTILKKLFGEIIITEEVANEYGEPLPEFIKIDSIKDKNYQRILETKLDKGEASVIALAIDKVDCLLILDDHKARNETKQLELNYTGTIGIFMLAIEKKFIED